MTKRYRGKKETPIVPQKIRGLSDVLRWELSPTKISTLRCHRELSYKLSTCKILDFYLEGWKGFPIRYRKFDLDIRPITPFVGLISH